MELIGAFFLREYASFAFLSLSALQVTFAPFRCAERNNLGFDQVRNNPMSY